MLKYIRRLQRILSTALNSWTNRVIELRARLITVSTSRDTTILRQSFNKWSTKSRQNIENLSLVDSFIEIQEEDLLRNRFRKWHASMKRKINLRDRLELKLKEDEEALKAGVLERWIDAFKERQLIEQVRELIPSARK
jgi:protein SFI1